MNEQLIIDNIIEELDNKRDITINKMKKTLLKDEMLKYSEEEDTIVIHKELDATDKLLRTKSDSELFFITIRTFSINIKF